MHANSYCFTVVRLVSGSPPPVGLDPCGFLCMIFGQGWTIRKVMGVGGGGGRSGGFSVCRNFVFCSVLVQECFSRLIPSARFFFFFVVVVFVFQKKKKL